ncbi:MAG TPA: CDP-diacylglycerol--glycerol-3-phosphate 3-phosphatidyltransferase [Streptosporangiaceae bacterium]|nr:CDP-diacylglycerol--glycerol-3-phosphate 3-phosphatidyltransferase [Streptosporangiaceae bacterium]
MSQPAADVRESGAASAGSAPGIVNVANGLTLARLLMVPFLVCFLVAGTSADRWIAFLVFVLASLTDLADGKLARRRGLVTDFGKMADPIADKALTGAALISLSCLGELTWWVTIVILARELAVTGLRFWVIRRGVIAATRGGKLKTVLQIVAISLYILPGPLGAARVAFMAAAVAATLVTGVDYLMRAVRLRRAVP